MSFMHYSGDYMQGSLQTGQEYPLTSILSPPWTRIRSDELPRFASILVDDTNILKLDNRDRRLIVKQQSARKGKLGMSCRRNAVCEKVRVDREGGIVMMEGGFVRKRRSDLFRAMDRRDLLFFSAARTHESR